MAQRTCTCGTVFTQRSNRHRYCSRACRPSEKLNCTCQVCGQIFTKATLRWNAGFCSILCRNYSRSGSVSSPLPRDHWGRWHGACSVWTPPASAASFQSGQCRECEASITEPANQTPSVYCSEKCGRRWQRRLRRAREHNAPGMFSYSAVMRQYHKQGSVCGYCHTHDGQPEAEHVLPLSRGGRNDMSNIIAVCHLCNADKNDMTVEEWNADRMRRGLSPMQVDLSTAAYAHLWLQQPTGIAARHRAAA